MKVGKKYKMVFNVFDKVLTYTGTVLEIGSFIKFKDIFNETISYNSSCLISYSEVEEEVGQ